VDTVGAGDAYTAGLVAALAERDALGRRSLATLDDADWLRVMAFAATTSALTCERAGSDPPTRNAVLARLPAGH
jgi:fructokinase